MRRPLCADTRRKACRIPYAARSVHRDRHVTRHTAYEPRGGIFRDRPNWDPRREACESTDRRGGVLTKCGVDGLGTAKTTIHRHPLPCDLSTLPWGRLIEGGAIWSTLDLRCVCKRTTLPMTARCASATNPVAPGTASVIPAQKDAGDRPRRNARSCMPMTGHVSLPNLPLASLQQCGSNPHGDNEDSPREIWHDSGASAPNVVKRPSERLRSPATCKHAPTRPTRKRCPLCSGLFLVRYYC
jgi:hypothetical protein